MKFLRYLFAVSVVLGTVILALSSIAFVVSVALGALSSIADNEDVAAFTFAQMSPPTPAPPTPARTRAPGPPVGIAPRPIPTLARPLDTEEQVLRQVLEYDARAAVWRKPWSLDTPGLEPGRISIKWHSDRSYDGSSYGPNDVRGPVWVVTIKGEVRLYPHPDAVYDGVTYVIDQNTGFVLRMTAGVPTQTTPLPTPPMPTTQSGSGVNPVALTSSSCTQNPSGLSFRVSQQPWKAIIPEVPGPIRSFSVEGTGFIPGERVNVVIKARVTGPATIASTAETVWPDSTFATSVGAAVSQPNMPFDLFVVHRRGVACVSIIAEQ